MNRAALANNWLEDAMQKQQRYVHCNYNKKLLKYNFIKFPHCQIHDSITHSSKLILCHLFYNVKLKTFVIPVQNMYCITSKVFTFNFNLNRNIFISDAFNINRCV